MVVDASAILAVLLQEPDAQYYRNKMESVEKLWISPINWWEVRVRLTSMVRLDHEEAAVQTASSIPITIVPIDAEQAGLALAAFQKFGKRPARLNMGDCFAYALAKQKDLPLLFKGNDFAATDVKVA